MEWGLHWFRWSAARKYGSPEGEGGSHKMNGLKSMQIWACPLKKIHLFCRFAFFAWLCPQGWPLCGKRLQGKKQTGAQEVPINVSSFTQCLSSPISKAHPGICSVFGRPGSLAQVGCIWSLFLNHKWGLQKPRYKGHQQNYLWVKGSYFELNQKYLMSVLCCAVLSHSIMSDSATPWTVACQAPLSMGILQARILKWVAMPSSRGSSQPRDWTHVSCTAGRFFSIWATGEAHEYWSR